MTHRTCRLTAKNQDQLQNPTLGNRVWATFTLFNITWHNSVHLLWHRVAWWLGLQQRHRYNSQLLRHRVTTTSEAGLLFELKTAQRAMRCEYLPHRISVSANTCSNYPPRSSFRTQNRTWTNSRKRARWIKCAVRVINNTLHTFSVICLGLPRWAGIRKVKPIWILLKQETVSGSGSGWAICKSAPRSRQITMPASTCLLYTSPSPRD